MRLPKNLTLNEGAAIPETWLTAYQLLVKIAKVKKGEYVLIYAGASGVGTAAIQLCKLLGAKALVTGPSQPKLDFCCKTLGAVAGFNYKDKPFAPDVLQFLDKDSKAAGVHIVLDCVGASQADQTLQVLQMDSRWVLYGSMGGPVVDKFPLAQLLAKRIQLTGTTLRTRPADYKADLVASFPQDCLPFFDKVMADGTTLRPIIDKVYVGLDQMPEAHKRMDADQNIGKLVVQVLPAKK